MKNRNKIRFFKISFLAVIFLCLILLGQAYIFSAKQNVQKNKIKERKEMAERPTEQVSSTQPPQASGDILPMEDTQEILEQFVSLYEENNDLIGWLSVAGTKIDYPVMQCEDDEYYLHHDFYGKESKYGCLYVKNRADLTEGTNFIIYGHNMKDGEMFGELDLYGEETFYREHPTILFDTLYEERTYEITAVFFSQVYGEDESVFKYYEFYTADTKEEFEDFYGNIKKLSLYDTGVEAKFGDTFLTLSTCAYHVEDGRLVVVAKLKK